MPYTSSDTQAADLRGWVQVTGVVVASRPVRRTPALLHWRRGAAGGEGTGMGSRRGLPIPAFSKTRVTNGNSGASSRHHHRPTRRCANATAPLTAPDLTVNTDFVTENRLAFRATGGPGVARPPPSYEAVIRTYVRCPLRTARGRVRSMCVLKLRHLSRSGNWGKTFWIKSRESVRRGLRAPSYATKSS